MVAGAGLRELPQDPVRVNAGKLYSDSLRNNGTVQATNDVLLCLTCHDNPHARMAVVPS